MQCAHLAYPDIAASGFDVQVVGEERSERNYCSRCDGAALVAGHDSVDAGTVLASYSEAERLEKNISDDQK